MILMENKNICCLCNKKIEDEDLFQEFDIYNRGTESLLIKKIGYFCSECTNKLYFTQLLHILRNLEIEGFARINGNPYCSYQKNNIRVIFDIDGDKIVIINDFIDNDIITPNDLPNSIRSKLPDNYKLFLNKMVIPLNRKDPYPFKMDKKMLIFNDDIILESFFIIKRWMNAKITKEQRIKEIIKAVNHSNNFNKK